MSETLIVYGDNQAEAVSIVLRRLAGIADHLDVLYISDTAPPSPVPAEVSTCRYLLEQESNRPFPYHSQVQKTCRRVTFPLLDFQLLWPLAAINPYNPPEPPLFPSGKFPYGNSFIINCIEQGVPPAEILALYRAGVWFDTWPNLDRRFVLETARWFAKDANCSVQLGSFILKNFCRERMFTAPRNPTNSLLAELIVRLLHECFEDGPSIAKDEVAALLASLGARDLLGAVSVPIHPKVVEHFGLVWSHADDRYNLFDVEHLTYDDYFEQMIETAVRVKPQSPPVAVKPAGRRTLILYGNCQADVVRVILAKFPHLSERFDLIYLRSFEHPTEGWQELQPHEIRNCALLFEQHDSRPFPWRAQLAEDARVVKFPSLDFNLLWPFNRVNPYNIPEPPIFPFGRFAYGDRIIVDCIDKGMAPEAILEYYLASWDDYAPDLDRLFELESARLTARDRHCDVKLGKYVIDEFRNDRLFWTVNHPTSALVCELIVRLLRLGFPDDPEVTSSQVAAQRDKYFAGDPLGQIHVPIHPRVAQHFDLRWYDADERHGSSGTSYSYVDYFRTMIKSSLALKFPADPALERVSERLRRSARGRPK